MCAVPKVSANFLEALERWDKGAVQCFCAQAVTFTKSWFWVSSFVYIAVGALFLVPAFCPLGLTLVLHHSWHDILYIIYHPMAKHPGSGLFHLPFTSEFLSLVMVVVPVVIWVLL